MPRLLTPGQGAETFECCALAEVLLSKLSGKQTRMCSKCCASAAIIGQVGLLTVVTDPEEGDGVAAGDGEAEGDGEFVSAFPSEGLLLAVVLVVFGCAELPGDEGDAPPEEEGKAPSELEVTYP